MDVCYFTVRFNLWPPPPPPHDSRWMVMIVGYSQWTEPDGRGPANLPPFSSTMLARPNNHQSRAGNDYSISSITGQRKKSTKSYVFGITDLLGLEVGLRRRLQLCFGRVLWLLLLLLSLSSYCVLLLFDTLIHVHNTHMVWQPHAYSIQQQGQQFWWDCLFSVAAAASSSSACTRSLVGCMLVSFFFCRTSYSVGRDFYCCCCQTIFFVAVLVLCKP